MTRSFISLGRASSVNGRWKSDCELLTVGSGVESLLFDFQAIFKPNAG